MARLLKGRGALDIIYSHLGLINVDLDLATKLGGASVGQAKKNFLNIHRRLADGIEASISGKKYDLVLIDCPPNFNIVTKTAIIASDYLLVPARPDYLSTLGISYLLRSVDALIKDYNDFAGVNAGQQTPKIDPKVLGVVFTMIQEYGGKPIAAQRPFMSQVRKISGIDVFPEYIKKKRHRFCCRPAVRSTARHSGLQLRQSSKRDRGVRRSCRQGGKRVGVVVWTRKSFHV